MPGALGAHEEKCLSCDRHRSHAALGVIVRSVQMPPSVNFIKAVQFLNA